MPQSFNSLRRFGVSSAVFLGLAFGVLHSGMAAEDPEPAAASAPAPTESAPSSNSSWLIAPYIWGPGLKGNVGFGPVDVPVDLGVRQLGSGVKAGAMGYLQWTLGQNFLYTDDLALRFVNPRFPQFFDEGIKTDVLFAEAGFGRHFNLRMPMLPANPVSLSPYVGLRYAQVEVSLINPAQTETVHDNWIDPVLGLIAEMPIYGPLVFNLKTDVGGLGVGHSRYWNGIGLFRYRFDQTWSVGAGYRVADFHANPGDGNQLLLRLHAAGPLLGVTITL